MPRKIQKKNKKKKKTKFLSLRHLNLNHTPAADEESVAEDFFAAAVEDTCGATLAALFGAVSPSDTAHSPVSCVGQDPAQDSGTLSPSLTCAPRDPFRGAMRGREERGDEKWVCYEEVTSCDAGVGVVKVHPRGLGLSLKLDYQEIIDAWCDKGSLYMPGPQTVPDLSDDFLNFRGSDGYKDGWRSHGSLWTVPENTVGKEKVEQELEEKLKLRHREASVLRYKEKRRNRLFSKRIRYEVRKINAEKRPRMKGRFVKRN